MWWKNTVFYEIYMPSFCDANGDGTGDFPGITSRLPYLKELGVGGIWLTPFYPSPKVDNGYDVSDYYGVDPCRGTMEDFEEMVEKAHGLGIKVIADMVVNHTSSIHPWFIESATSKDSPKRDWYIWKDAVDGKHPNNWESFFGGSAWEMDERTGQYYYHSFAKEQVDLNWCNPQVEEGIYKELHRMIRLYGPKGSPTLFFGSHDMGRFSSRFGFTDRKIKCLLTLMLTFRGVPFLYFGDETGIRSRVLESVEEADDIQGIMAYEAALNEGKSRDEAVKILNKRSRDASRSPMDWETADRQRQDRFSIWNYVRNLIAIRSSGKELTEGELFLGEAAKVRRFKKEESCEAMGEDSGTGSETGSETAETSLEIMELERTLGNKRTGVFINFSDCDASLVLKRKGEVILASEKEVRCVDGRTVLLPGGSTVILEYKDE